MRWRSGGWGMHGDKSQAGVGEEGGVSGVRLGNDGMLTVVGGSNREVVLVSGEVSGAVWDTGLVGVGTVSEHC